MNVNLLNILNRIVAEYGEFILSDPVRLKPLFADYAKNEQKEDRVAFGRCIEMGAYQELKKTHTAAERQHIKASLVNQVNAKTGVDRQRCADALVLLETVLFGEQQKNYCKNCGKEMQNNWVTCPYCLSPAVNTSRVISSAITSVSGSGNNVPYTSSQTNIQHNSKKLSPLQKIFITFIVFAALAFVAFVIFPVINEPVMPSIITDVKVEAKYSYTSDKDAFIGIFTDIIEVDPNIFEYISLFELIGIFRSAMFEEDQEIEKWLKFKYGKELKFGEAIKIVYKYKGEKIGFDFIYKPYNKDIFSQKLVSVYEFVTFLENIKLDSQ